MTWLTTTVGGAGFAPLRLHSTFRPGSLPISVTYWYELICAGVRAFHTRMSYSSPLMAAIEPAAAPIWNMPSDCCSAGIWNTSAAATPSL